MDDPQPVFGPPCVATHHSGAVRVCLRCGREFRANHERQQYCSQPCRFKAWEAKHPRVDIEKQGTLFGVTPPPPSPSELERRRLSKQCEAILARLREGPVTNTELAGMALKYTSRISDLRERGHVIEVKSHDHGTGVVVYVLKEGA